MREVFPVASKTVLVSVEDWGVLRGRSVFGPVPIGCVTFVATLVAEGLFVLVQEPAMPAEEIASVVNLEGFLHVDHDEVIKLEVTVSANV